jgi:uncharacterized protein HemY
MLEAMQTASRRGSTNGLVQAYRQAGRDKDARELAWKHAGQDHPSMNAVNYAYLAAVAGIPERAHDLLEAAKPSESGQVHLLRARVHAVLGEMDQARSWLRKAHAAGYRHPRTAAEDVDFRPLADDPAWTTLLE